jgi:hypothetical protein
MAITASSPRQQSSGQKSNIFLDVMVIKASKDVTEKEQQAGFQHDVAIQLELGYTDPEKSEWSKTITVGSGKMVRSEPTEDHPKGKVVDWGAGFKVRDLLLAAGLPGECGDDGEVNYPELVGKEVKMLTYISSNTDRGKSWNHFTSATRPDKSFIDYFIGQTKPNRKGNVYVKDFKDPNVSPENAMSSDTDLSGPWDDEQSIGKDFI